MYALERERDRQTNRQTSSYDGRLGDLQHLPYVNGTGQRLHVAGQCHLLLMGLLGRQRIENIQTSLLKKKQKNFTYILNKFKECINVNCLVIRCG